MYLKKMYFCKIKIFYMIQSLEIKNFGPLEYVSITNFGPINLFIGPNRSGKTVLLKALYCAQKAIELYGRGKNKSTIAEILADKLYWTFQVNKIGNIVRKPNAGPLSFTMKEQKGGRFSFSFGADTEKKISQIENSCASRASNSIFIPAKEVLSLLNIIKYNREIQLEFGFDETYYDLAKALTPPTKGKIAAPCSAVRESLKNALGGKIEYSKDKKTWVYYQGKLSFDINVISEGTKKIAIFDTLIGNHFLTKGSIIFIDEPESGLHPGLLMQLMDIVVALAKYGMQFFIASHSYFVIKKLLISARQEKMSIPVISFDSSANDAGISISNLAEGMPENPIIDESINLYEQELSL